MEKHKKAAPGPWTAEGWENVIVNDEQGNTLALMPGGGPLTTVKANALLIAAAPDLLNACQLAYDWMQTAEFDFADYVSEALKQAIAKATQP